MVKKNYVPLTPLTAADRKWVPLTPRVSGEYTSLKPTKRFSGEADAEDKEVIASLAVAPAELRAKYERAFRTALGEVNYCRIDDSAGEAAGGMLVLNVPEVGPPESAVEAQAMAATIAKVMAETDGLRVVWRDWQVDQLLARARALDPSLKLTVRRALRRKSRTVGRRNNAVRVGENRRVHPPWYLGFWRNTKITLEVRKSGVATTPGGWQPAPGLPVGMDFGIGGGPVVPVIGAATSAGRTGRNRGRTTRLLNLIFAADQMTYRLSRPVRSISK